MNEQPNFEYNKFSYKTHFDHKLPQFLSRLNSLGYEDLVIEMKKVIKASPELFFRGDHDFYESKDSDSEKVKKNNEEKNLKINDFINGFLFKFFPIGSTRILESEKDKDPRKECLKVFKELVKKSEFSEFAPDISNENQSASTVANPSQEPADDYMDKAA